FAHAALARAPERLPLDSRRPGAPRTAERARAARGLGARSVPAHRRAPAHHRRGARLVPGRWAYLGARISEHAARRRSERALGAGGRLATRAGTGAGRVDEEPGT